MKNTLFLLCLIFSVSSITGQVVINEYSASNLNNILDGFGRTEDWIELYNTSSSTVNIGGWHLSDKASKPAKWKIPAGTAIPANGFLTFYCSGRDGVFNNGEYHTNFKLTQTQGSDLVLLSDPSENVLETHALSGTLVEHSHCRAMDGGATWKICTAPSFGTSNNATTQVDGYTVAPTMDLEAGFYNGTQTVSITNNEPNSVLRYTTDGNNPTATSPVYSSPITVSSTTVIKAQAFSNDSAILPGKMDFNTYFIDEDFTLAVFSVAADEVINLANGNGDLIPIGSLEYFNTDKEREATSYGSLNRHGQDSWVLDHRSIDWISRDEMGYSKAVNAPLFSYSDRDEYQKFMFRNSGDDNYPAINDGQHEGSTHIRDEFIHQLAQDGGMKLDVRAVERVIVFLNGQYWGVYGMRERPVDHDYTKEYYDQGKYDIQYLSTWGNTEIEYGGIQAQNDWINLRNFILSNDMSIDANYQIAKDSINLTSMIDYFLVNLNVVASDWLNYNTGWWRGRDPDGDHKKWGYILWDLDASFDYYINYSGVPDISPNAEPCDLEEIGDFMDDFFGGGGGGTYDPVANPDQCQTIQNGSSPYPYTDIVYQTVIAYDAFCCESDWDGICQSAYDNFATNGIPTPPTPGGPTTNNDVGQHEKILLKLLDENEEFQQLYYSRYADIMNTVFSCDNMLTLLDEMLDVIRPEMPRQIQRWGGSMTEWESNVQDLKDFISARCQNLDDGALACYDELSGPYNLTLRTIPDGIGEIDFNTLDIEEFLWSGTYFGGMQNNIKAKVFNDFEDMYEFSHWESSSSNVILPNVNERRATYEMMMDDTLTAVFSLITSTNDLGNYAFNVYPNPAKDYLVVEFELDESMDVQMDLFNMMGQKIKSFSEVSRTQGAGQNRLELDLSGVSSSGLYILEIQVGEDRISQKINIVR